MATARNFYAKPVRDILGEATFVESDGTLDLTNATTNTYDVGIKDITNIQISCSVVASGVAHDRLSGFKSATAGSIDVTAEGATGTTVVYYLVRGRGRT